MNPTHSNAPVQAPRRSRHLRTAVLAYITAVCASMAAAAALVTETVPLVVGGL